MNNESVSTHPSRCHLGYLIAIRPLLFLIFQVLLFGLPWIGAQAQARMYWPIPVILTNVVCIFLMVWLARISGSNIKKLYLAPFEDDLGMKWINRWRPAQKTAGWINYFLVFVLLFAGLGFLALSATTWISSLIGDIALLPDVSFPYWGGLLIVVILPLSQIAAEIPWYNGLFFPLLEQSARTPSIRNIHSTVFAFAVVTLVFSLQHAFMPFIPVCGFWIRCIMWLPVTLVIALVVRLFPRLMPLLVLSHGLMALTVASRFL